MHCVLSIKFVTTVSLPASCNCIFLWLETENKFGFSEVQNSMFLVYSLIFCGLWESF